MEKYNEKPTSKFEGADQAISGGYEDKRDELREVPNDVVRETKS